MKFLELLASIRNPILNSVMQIITYIGEETVFMLVTLIVFWCISKKHGYYLLITGFFGTLLSQFLKLVCRIPRPWLQKPGFKAVDSALPGASGYSFPSGHTQNAVSTFGGIARFTKKAVIRWVCIALALLISFSRMYLGVHTPLDVGFAFATALFLLLVLYPIMEKTDEKPQIMYILSAVMIVLSIGYLCYVNLILSPDEFDADGLENYRSGVENGWKMFGALLTLPLMYTLDLKKIRFREEAPLVGQILKVVLGLLCVLAIKEGLKPVLRAVFGEGAPFADALRYFVLVLFAGCVWPLTFPFFQKIGKKRAKSC